MGRHTYGHLGNMASFFQPGKTAIHFLVKNLLMRSPVNTANGDIFKSQTVESLMISPH